MGCPPYPKPYPGFRLQFDFRNIFNLRPLSLTGLASIVLLLFSLLLLSLCSWGGRHATGTQPTAAAFSDRGNSAGKFLLMAILPVGISPLTGSSWYIVVPSVIGLVYWA